MRTADDRTILFVEGESDCQALDSHIDSECTYSLPAGGKQTVLKVRDLIRSCQIERVVFLVDRDLGAPASEGGDDLFVTDFYDLDATLFFSADILGRVVHSHLPRGLVHQLAPAGVVALPVVMGERLQPLSALRIVSLTTALHLNLGGFPMDAVLTSDFQIDTEKLCSVAISRTEPRPSRTVEELRDAIWLEIRSNSDIALAHCGHDLYSILAASARKLRATAGKDALEKAARAALNCAELHKFLFVAAMQRWADDHGTRIWNCWA